MAPRRHSRTPLMLSIEEQKILVLAADNNPRLRESIERLFGVKWADLSMQQKIRLIHDFDEAGRAAGALAGAVEGHRNLERQVALYNDELATEDKLRLAEEQIQTLKDEIVMLKNPRRRSAVKAVEDR